MLIAAQDAHDPRPPAIKSTLGRVPDRWGLRLSTTSFQRDVDRTSVFFNAIDLWSRLLQGKLVSQLMAISRHTCFDYSIVSMTSNRLPPR